MAPRVLRKYTGKVKAKNPKAFSIFQHLPDRFQCILAEKFPVQYYPTLILTLRVIKEHITEYEPFGSTSAPIDRSEVIGADYFIGNEENDVTIRSDFIKWCDIFGSIKATQLVDRAYEMAFKRFGETLGEWD